MGSAALSPQLGTEAGSNGSGGPWGAAIVSRHHACVGVVWSQQSQKQGTMRPSTATGTVPSKYGKGYSMAKGVIRPLPRVRLRSDDGYGERGQETVTVMGLDPEAS